MSRLASQAEQHVDFSVMNIRNDFPILSQKVNDRPLIYFDNAATAQKPFVMIDTINDYYRRYNANIHRGIHALSEQATMAYEEARESVREFINAKTVQEIIFVRGTTEAINLVAHSFARKFLQTGDEILISTMEHHANIVPWQLAGEMFGTKLKVIPIDDKGEIILEEFEKCITEKTKLLAITHISNALGTINPLLKMIEIARRKNLYILIDGAQAVPHIRVDVQALDCDFYAFSGHKLYGPTGIGVLYGKKALLDQMPPYQGGGDMIRQVTFDKTTFNDLPNKFEAGTPHIAGAIGLRAAIHYLQEINLPQAFAYEHELLNYATEELSKVPHLQIIGRAKEKAPVISFVMEDVHPHDIGTILNHHGIAVRSGHHCAMPLMERFKVPATVRVSLSFYNTFAEIDELVRSLKKVREVFTR